MRWLIPLLLILLSGVCLSQAQSPKQRTYFVIRVEYTEGQIPMDGTFLYPLNEKGDLQMGKLGTIKKAYDFTLNELKEILQDRFPDVAKNTFNVTLFHFNEDAHIKANSILIMGHVENAGNFVLNKTDDLSELLKQNKPDPFAATNRVVILRKGKRLVFDMRKPKQRVTLEAGDIIHVPHKFSFSK